MGLNGKVTTNNFSDVSLIKPNAASFTVDVSNQYAVYQFNVAPFGRGDSWAPSEGIDIGPGYWNFTALDWSEFGVDRVSGIRFKSKVTANPAVISVS